MLPFFVVEVVVVDEADKTFDTTMATTRIYIETVDVLMRCTKIATPNAGGDVWIDHPTVGTHKISTRKHKAAMLQVRTKDVQG